MEQSVAGKKILIVDDDQYLLGVYASKFREEKFDVKTANDGQEAWELIQGGYVPDVVFTGILMPRMTGFDLIRNMQADAKLKDIPTAISSHRGRPEDRVTAKELGVDDFLIQGLVTLNEVVRRIKRLLGVEQSYRVQVDRNRYDSEGLISLLESQDSDSAEKDKGKLLLLELHPRDEKGLFHVEIVREDMGL